jgi:hypothetical protein
MDQPGASDPSSAAEGTQPPIESPEAPVQPPGPVVEVPGFRDGIARSLDLCLKATDRLRRASIYIGLQYLAILAPTLLVLVLILTRHPEVADAIGRVSNGEVVSLADQQRAGSLLVVAIPGFLIAVLGLTALAIDGAIIGMAILAGMLVDRPVALRASVAWARTRFWGVIRAGLLIGIPTAILNWFLTEAFGPIFGRESDATFLISSTLSAFALLPFVYTSVGVVLGDVGAAEAARRSIRLERARMRLAVLIAAVSAAIGVIQVFAFGSGGDLLFRIATALGLGFDRGTLPALATVVILLAAIAALGSLTFTVTAIASAPQVIGFISLTGYLDAVDRGSASSAGSGVAWLSRTMLVGIGLSVLFALLAVASLPA